IVFVGPSLPAAEVRARLPGATVAGPVAVGEVLALVRRRGRHLARLAIVDGYFEGMAAVWHKELLVALARGIAVYGAASMGALRAAELAPYGMRGVGRIYRAFAAGRLVADDEVAVAHLPAEYGYRPTGDALVNLREAIAAAPGLSARTRAALVELARARFYRERSLARLVADARAAGLPARSIAALAARPVPDRKAADARLLLSHLARGARDPGLASRPAIAVPRTWALRQLEAWLDDA
ncbi:MAG: TfuA domain-containing protein, partial [Deltaproteobacteria bacterium]|nr:TfuA domain-containing protein [Deltaproteobacteria bacterium]